MKNKLMQSWKRHREVTEMAEVSDNDVKILAFLCWK